MIQRSLFDEKARADYSSWAPREPPSLDGIDEIELDVETSGLRWYGKDRVCGIAIRIPSGDCWYLPIRHAGGNLPIDSVLRWCKRELRNKHITNISTRFDIHMLKNDGIDLEEQGCTVEDVGHWAALLDDHRRSFSLENISQNYLGYGKVKGLDLSQGAHIYHAGEVADYAMRDVHLVGELKKVMLPLLIEQDLQIVRQLESNVIYPVCEMERNGVHIDEERLDSWKTQTKKDIERLFWEIHRETGLKVDVGSSKSLKRLFAHLKIDNPYTTKTGAMSFADAVFERLGGDHPIMARVRRMKKLESLRSKFLVEYRNQLDRFGDDILRYALHQLRSDEGGTVSGRFSSSVLIREYEEGVNIQQVMSVKKQRRAWGYDEDDSSHDDEIYVVRKLIKAPNGRLFISSDGMQIEYRWFAHYTNSPAILSKYRENPRISFHKMVGDMFRKTRPDISYKNTKDLNFAFVFGAGIVKIASMLGVSENEAKKVVNEYHTMFPEVHKLIRKAMKTAEERGYVKTYLGRRARFPTKKRLHKALNSVIQGSATGDYMKLKIVELHEARKQTDLKLRATIHDEIIGDVPDQAAADKVTEILDRQSLPLRVPILWETVVGHHWAEC